MRGSQLKFVHMENIQIKIISGGRSHHAVIRVSGRLYPDCTKSFASKFQAKKNAVKMVRENYLPTGKNYIETYFKNPIQ